MLLKKLRDRRLGLFFSMRIRIVAVSILAIIVAMIAVVEPMLYRMVIDDVVMNLELTSSDKTALLGKWFMILLGFMLISYFLGYLRSYQLSVLNNRLMSNVRYRLMRHMFRLPQNRIEEMRVGGAVHRLNQDSFGVAEIVSRAIISPGVALIQAIVCVFVVLILNWKLLIGAICVILPMGLMTYCRSKRIRTRFGRIHELGAELSCRTTEMFSGLRMIRLFCKEKYEQMNYIRMCHRILRKQLKLRRIQIHLEMGWNLIFGLIQLVVVLLGGYLVVLNQATIGDVFAVVLYAGLIMGPVGQIASSFAQVQENLSALDRIIDVFNMEQDVPDPQGARVVDRNFRTLSVKNVEFGYEKSRGNVLNDVSFEIRSGQVVALVGRSGSGKSTLVDLITRIYRPDFGAILLDGVDVFSLRRESYRGLFAVVPQDVFLFDGDVGENIAYARVGASQADILSAARSACAHEFIERLPDGYKTRVGERGVKLSYGQRQRVSIARAFLADPKILILDEATSNLDSESEELIQKALTTLLRGRTAIIIAHRLSTIINADNIVVLKGGKVEEQGSHCQLMKNGGVYSGMIAKQQSVFN